MRNKEYRKENIKLYQKIIVSEQNKLNIQINNSKYHKIQLKISFRVSKNRYKTPLRIIRDKKIQNNQHR